MSDDVLIINYANRDQMERALNLMFDSQEIHVNYFCWPLLEIGVDKVRSSAQALDDAARHAEEMALSAEYAEN